MLSAAAMMPRRLASAAMRSRSASLSIGLLGVSTQISRVCGWIAETEWLDNDPEAAVCTLAERFSEPQFSEPAEYEPICVQCGAINPFVEMTVCDECQDYPCTCEELP